MVEDTPVNTGALVWPSPEVAADRVRRMQLKLHRWAVSDPGRRFDDVFVRHEAPV
jgi:RNA-directed DNA polymerase